MNDDHGVSRSLSFQMINQFIHYNIVKRSDNNTLDPIIMPNILKELDSQGHLLGNRIAHRLTISSSCFWDDKRALVFLCKNVWPFLFQKQVDKLQADGKGTFIIKDSNLPWISNITLKYVNLEDPSELLARSRMLIQLYQALISGIIRGVLDSLGIHSTIYHEQEDPNSHSCIFKISIRKY